MQTALLLPSAVHSPASYINYHLDVFISPSTVAFQCCMIPLQQSTAKMVVLLAFPVKEALVDCRFFILLLSFFLTAKTKKKKRANAVCAIGDYQPLQGSANFIFYFMFFLLLLTSTTLPLTTFLSSL